MKVCVARWQAGALATLLLVHAILASPLQPRPPRRRVTRQAFDQEYVPTLRELEAEQQILEDAVVFGPELAERGPRDKRTVRLLLNALFWKINTLLQFKTRILGNISEGQRLGGRATTVSTTAAPPDDVPDFDSNRVMLDIPGELFGTAFTIVTDVSKIVGDVILNTARRTQRFIEALKPAIARTLGYKITALTGASSVSTNTAETAETTDS